MSERIEQFKLQMMRESWPRTRREDRLALMALEPYSERIKTLGLSLDDPYSEELKEMLRTEHLLGEGPEIWEPD